MLLDPNNLCPNALRLVGFDAFIDSIPAASYSVTYATPPLIAICCGECGTTSGLPTSCIDDSLTTCTLLEPVSGWLSEPDAI